MRRTLTAVIAGAAMLFAAQAFSVEAGFNNHLKSTTIVSPAQLYQIDKTETDFQLGLANGEATMKPKAGDKTTISMSGPGLYASGIYTLPALGLRAGLSVDYSTYTVERKAGSVKDESNSGEGNEMDLSLQGAYPVGPMVAGLALETISTSVKTEEDGAKEQTSNYTRMKLGGLYATSDLEAGFVYTSPNHIVAEKDTEDDVTEAAIVALHGRKALDKTMAVGAILANHNWKAIDEDANKDQTVLTGTFEYTADALKVEGDLAYKTAYYKEKEAINSGNISTMALGGAADYSLNDMTTLGGGLEYEFGSDSANDVDYDVSVMTLSFRGNMVF